jgi:hypothetical protein
MVVDHIDLADVNVGRSSPFEGAASGGFLIDFIKMMIETSSFVVGVKDSSAAENVLPPVSDLTAVDLTDSVTFASTLDIVPIPTGPQKEFIVSFDGDHPQIALGVAHFGGCPAYLEAWAEINRRADRLGDAEQSGGDVEEERLFLHASIEATLRRIFLDADGRPFARTVLSAVRVDAKM